MSEFQDFPPAPPAGPSGEVASGINSIVVRPNLALFWLKTTLTVTPKGITGSIPNTIFGVIPLGYKDVMFPLRQVSGVSVITKFSVLRLIVGLILATVGWALILPGIFGVIMLFNVYTAQLQIFNTGMAAEVIGATWLDKAILESYANQVRAHLLEI